MEIFLFPCLLPLSLKVKFLYARQEQDYYRSSAILLLLLLAYNNKIQTLKETAKWQNS